MTSDKLAAIQENQSFRILVLNRQLQFKILKQTVLSICSRILRALDQPPCAVTVVFAGARKMRNLNCLHRGRDYPTDVLSFPYPGEREEARDFLGEIVIAPEIAAGNAARWGSTPEVELRRLLIHGILHLLGHDHETDGGEMNRLQRRLMRRRFMSTSGRILSRS